MECVSATIDRLPHNTYSPYVQVREAARAALRPWARVSSSLGGGRRFRGAHGDADRGEYAGIARRGGALHTTVGTGASSSSNSDTSPAAADPDADVEPWGDADELNAAVLADDGSFGAVAGRYPLFTALVRFLTSLDDDEEATAVAVETTVAGDLISGGKRQRTGGSSWSTSSNEATHAIVDAMSERATPQLSYVDQPDGTRAPLGRVVTSLPPIALAAAIEFTNTALDATAVMAGLSTAAYVARLDADDGDGGGLTILHAYRSLLELGLSVEPAAPDAATAHVAAAACLARLLEAAPARLCYVYGSRLSWLLRWLRDTNVEIRRSIALVLGTAVSALPLDDDAATPPVAADEHSCVRTPTVAAVVTDLVAVCSTGQTSVRTVDIRHGALLALGRALGLIGARLSVIRGHMKQQEASSNFDELIARATGVIVQSLGDRSETVRASATAALTLIARCGALPLPESTPLVTTGDTLSEAPAASPAAEMSLDSSVAAAAAAASAVHTREQLVALLLDLATGRIGRAATASPAAAVAAEDAEAASRGEGRHTAITEAAAVCLGAIASGELRSADNSIAAGATNAVLQLPRVAAAAIDALLQLAQNKFEAVQFTVGAALLEAASGTAALLPDGGSRSDFTLSTFASNSGTAQATGSAIADAAALHALATSQILDAVLAGPLQSISAHERTAATVWLLSLVAGLGRRRSSRPQSIGMPLAKRLPQLQAAFSRLLSDKSQFTQEAAAKGLALVYEAADEEGGVRASLVSSLVATLDTGRRAPGTLGLSGTAAYTAGDGGIGAGPASLALSAGGVGAYKELCAVANEAGNPELIYKFLALSGHHAMWHTRGGAGFGLEALLSTSALAAVAPYLDRLIPKIFRYLYDPSQRVRESMERLWSALVRDPKAAVTRHCGSILDELIQVSSAADWREREAAVAALADVLLGRSGADVTTRLESLWRATLRSIDDIKESVKEAGVACLKVLGRLTVRLCDPAASGDGGGAPAVSVVLPFLLHDGLTNPLPAAQSACLAVLSDIVGVAGSLLRPHIPDLVHTALASMGNLENAQLSHLQMHADAGTGHYGAGLSSERLELARISAARSGPLGDVIDKCTAQLRSMNIVALMGEAGAASISSTAVADVRDAHVTSRDDELDRSGVFKVRDGSMEDAKATVAASSILAPLVERLRTLIRSGVGLPTRGATARFIAALPSSLPDAAVRACVADPLLRTLAAALNDASPTLRREFSAAAAALCRLAKPTSVSRYAARISELARDGSDASMRTSSGVACALLARATAERLRDIGVLHDLLPVAFLACGDAEAAVRTAWGDAWDSMAMSSTPATLRLYAVEIVAAITDGLAASSWLQKRQAAAALTRMVAALGGVGSPETAASIVSDGVWLPMILLTAVEQDRLGPAAWRAVDHSSESRTEYYDRLGTHAARSITAHGQRLVPPEVPELVPHAPILVASLLAAIPGRVYDGKDALLTALGAIVSACPRALGALPPVLPAIALQFKDTHPRVAATDGMHDALDDNVVIYRHQQSVNPLSTQATTADDTVVDANSESGHLLSANHVRRISHAVPDISAVVRCLATQASRPGVPLSYAAAAMRSLAVVCGALSTVDCYVAVIDSVAAVLSRCGRASVAAELTLNSYTAVTTLSAAALPQQTFAQPIGPRLIGGRSGEGRENEARAAAKDADAADGACAVACYAALAAAFPVAVTHREDDTGTDSESADAAEAIATAYTSTGGADVLPAALSISRRIRTNAHALATRTLHESRVASALKIAVAGASLLTERVALFRAAAAVAAKSPLTPQCDLLLALIAAANADDKFAAGRTAAMHCAIACLQVATASGTTAQLLQPEQRVRFRDVAMRLRTSPDPTVAGAAGVMLLALL